MSLFVALIPFTGMVTCFRSLLLDEIPSSLLRHGHEEPYEDL